MATDEHVQLLRQGVEVWNRWRIEHERTVPDLSAAILSSMNLDGVNFAHADLRDTLFAFARLNQANLSGANLSNANFLCAKMEEAIFTRANLNGASFTDAILTGANLSGIKLGGMVNFVGANLTRANLTGAALPWSYFRRAILKDAHLEGADLTAAIFSQADLTKAVLPGANLVGTNLVGTILSKADLTGCRVYGTCVWDSVLDGAKQKDLIITNPTAGEPEITVDDIEVAQFVYLMLHNQKIRDVIDTITSKAVLILGRFTEQRMVVLEALRKELRNRGLLPVLFDFAIPASRDVTETIKVLAGLARFVIADITDATEVRVELHKIVPDFTSLPVQPILLRGHPEFVSLPYLAKFPWVLPVFLYDDQEHLLANLDKSVVSPAEFEARRRRGQVP